ncbi:uncharacterized membrane protein YgdD (TMEM256/DUF423 family) [Litorivivens lipolytica]|uniref:Uncharacterized membrane protein YgdD (TMEM256/DUF423 family) n=1 Tax=Litorivivens lipolytica TaxID=1524264 RepID=A0A7W4W7D5_9GAMM|nr:DUF423 domain-containing protein [Litorivivens lipolytica]MBB3048831.1 uncharacterized membrane protein YgdD (TMEM256/DUF423 family) [Litorivivens lipolytica]
MGQFFLAAAAVSGFLAVALGAFGAHALKSKLSADMLAVYETAVQYHFYHTLALLAVSVLMVNGVQGLKLSGILFLVGTVIFSCGLYALALSGIKILGAITPIGGLCLLAGWACLAFAAIKGLS